MWSYNFSGVVGGFPCLSWDASRRSDIFKNMLTVGSSSSTNYEGYDICTAVSEPQGYSAEVFAHFLRVI